MNKILLITNTIDMNANGGRELLCKLNYKILKELFKDKFFIHELKKNKLSVKDLPNAFKGHIDGINYDSITEIKNIIEKESITDVFIDGSNLGEIAKIIKKISLEIEIYTFFHNVESRFFLGSFKRNKSIKSFLVFLVNYLAEKKSVFYSDNILSINERDSELLKRVYKRKADYIHYMSLEDKLTNQYINKEKSNYEKFCLFVGGTFYANVDGIFWFAKNVSSHINLKTYVVGKGFEKYKRELESYDNINVIGKVDSLEEWYHNAEFVIAPIFDGSGMKTKVAEALMYGKKVIGTKESFTGYEQIIDKAGKCCNTSTEFIDTINLFDKDLNKEFNYDLRLIYENIYSYTAAINRFKDFFKGKI